MGLSIAIDASRARSGGARSHINGILSSLTISKYEIDIIHIWSYKGLLSDLPAEKWLVKHFSFLLERSLFLQIFWQKFILKRQIEKYNCDILLTLDGSSFCNFSPQIVMSRDLLSYEPGIRQLYGIGLSRLRIELIKIIQNRSFKNAQGVVFLSKYAQNLITRSCGKIENSVIIPHGFNSVFRNIYTKDITDQSNEFNCVYVSNAEFYKHQIEVIRAISFIRNSGINIKLHLIGGGKGRYYNSVCNEIKVLDPDGKYITFDNFIPNGEIPLYISTSDLFVFASGCEAFGITLLEAMSTGVPIICSNKSSLPELIGDSALLFDPSNIDSIVEVILKMYYSPELRKNYSKASIKRSEDFSWNKCSDDLFMYLISIYKLFKV